MTDAPNPFDDLDDPNWPPDGYLRAAPRPGLAERFRINFEAGQRYNTVLGALKDTTRAENRRRFDSRYESFPEWDGTLEGMAALGGNIAGTAWALENFIPIGAGAKAVAAMRVPLATWRARIFAGAIDAAIVNTATDSSIQGIEIAGGTRKAFDPLQLATSTAIGTVAGGALGPLTHGKSAGERLGSEIERGADAYAGRPAGEPIERAIVSPESPTPSRPVEGMDISFNDAMPGRKAGQESRAASSMGGNLPDAPNASPGVPEGVSEPEPVALGDRLAQEAGLPPKDVAAMAPRDRGTNAPDVTGEGPFGPIIDASQYADRWSDLVGRLKEMKTGEAVGALEHPEVGPIDVIYGAYDAATDRGYGLKKILDKHPEVVENLPDIITRAHVVSRSENRIILDTGPERAVIRLDLDGSEKTWLLTAYEKRRPVHGKEPESQRAEGTTGRPDNHQPDTSSGSLASRNIGNSNPSDNPRPSHGEVDRGGSSEGGSGARTVSNQTRQSSGSPPQEHIVSAEREVDNPGANSAEKIGDQRAEGSTARPDSRQPDTSSSSLAGESVEPQADIDNPGEDFFARLNGARGQRKRASGGVTSRGDKGHALVRLRDVSNRLADLVQVAGTRQGRFSVRASGGGRVEGQYSRRSGVVRVRDQDDFDTFTHEIGHHVDTRFNDELTPFFQLYGGEISGLAYPGAPEDAKVAEGFAEYFRLFMTNPAYGTKHAPRFDKAFRKWLKEDQPDLLGALEQIQDAYRAWLRQPSTDAVGSTIVSGAKRGFLAETRETMRRHGVGRTIADWLHSGYGAFVDDLHPLQRAVRGLAEIHKRNTGKTLELKAVDDAYILSRMSRGAHQAGHMDIIYGVHSYRGTRPVSPSLRDALVEAFGEPNALSKWDEDLVLDFGAYLWSRRALGEWDRFAAGEIPNPPDKLTKGDHEMTVTELSKSNPAFVSAADKVYEWSRALWAKKRDAGLITDEQYMRGLEIRDYVPGLRSFDYDGDVPGKGGRRGQSAKSGYARQFRGSTRDVINPVESLVSDAYQTAQAIARNDVIKQLDRLALLAGNGAGEIAERIPATQIAATMVDPLEAVSAAARKAGLDEPDIMVLRDSLEGLIGDEKTAIFRPAVINEKGETIAFFREAGELRALRLADGRFGKDMYRALTMMSAPEQNVFVKMLAAPATLLRAGITTAPEFILANLARDQVMASIFYGKPFTRLGQTLSGSADELLSRDAARAYNQAGGIMGGANTAALRDLSVNRDLQALRRKGWKAERLTSFKGILQVSEISETGMRIGLFKTFFNEAKKRGLDEFEATFEAAWRARDHIDFDRHGWMTVSLSRIIPFLNASIQGFDKTTRHMIAPLAKRAFGEALTVEDERAMGQAVKAWARLAALTVAGMSLHALMSRHEDYDEISDTTRATHWMVKTGDKWTAIPKPFEMAVATNIGEALWDAWAKDDPLAAARYVEGLFQVLVPPSIATGNPAIKSFFELKSNQDFFLKRDIVPDYMQGLEPWLQYRASTSELSKQLGKATDMSPMVLDKLITNMTGSWGRSALSLYDWAASNKPGPGFDDMPFTRRFIKDASKGSRSSRRFWDLISTSAGSFEGAAKSYRAMMDGGDVVGAQDYLSTLDSEERAFVTISMMDAKARRLHPLLRARSAIRALGKVRRQLSSGRVQAGSGEILSIPRGDRGAADDILADISMAEARNSLILMGVQGWKQLQPMETAGYFRELKAVSPDLYDLLADQYATAKVLPADTVARIWPDLRRRALQDGTDAITVDLEAEAGAAGYELDGIRIPRKSKPPVPGLAGAHG